MGNKSVKLISRELKEMLFQEARFLTEEEQGRYDDAVKSFGEKARRNLNVPCEGSNLFKVLLLNQLGIRTATLFELESALENGLPLEGTYEDSRSVVLRSVGDSYNPNDYIAKGLAELIKKKRFPHAVVIEGLKVKEDSQSDYGLSFEKAEEFRIIEAPDLDHVNDQRRFKKINPDYTIDFDDKSRRTLYTKNEGVSRLCLNGDLDLDSRLGDLAYSDADGRVVVVSGLATSQKIWDEFTTNLKAESARQMRKLQKD